MEKISKFISDISPMKIIFFGYIVIILLGAVLLFMPFATKEGFTSFSDAFFTAASATCVTGLVRFDTYTHWSLFGQIVILCLIQIGGIGFMTMAIAFMTASNRKISLSSRILMQNSISAPQIGGIVKMTKFVVLGTLIVEGTGAFLLALYFCPKIGFIKGIWYGVFHSISAFCNAGFDLMGFEGQYSSLTSLYSNWYVNIIIMLLIVIGGLGFFVWKDSLVNKLRFKNLKLHSKIVISSSLALIIIGAVCIFVLEFGSAAFEGFSIWDKIITSLFQSVTSRTAGFNTLDFTKMTEGGIFVMICLMIVGGSPGSTAGGMKTTTFAVILLSVFASARGRKDCQVFGRRIESDILPSVLSIFIMYTALSSIAAVTVSHLEGIPMIDAVFECVSAMATVGLTMGVTPELGFISKIIVACLMIIGRVGSLTVLMAVASPKAKVNSKLPVEKIQVG